jgi:hypothetical protein
MTISYFDDYRFENQYWIIAVKNRIDDEKWKVTEKIYDKTKALDDFENYAKRFNIVELRLFVLSSKFLRWSHNEENSRTNEC